MIKRDDEIQEFKIKSNSDILIDKQFKLIFLVKDKYKNINLNIIFNNETFNLNDENKIITKIYSSLNNLDFKIINSLFANNNSI